LKISKSCKPYNMKSFEIWEPDDPSTGTWNLSSSSSSSDFRNRCRTNVLNFCICLPSLWTTHDLPHCTVSTSSIHFISFSGIHACFLLLSYYVIKHFSLLCCIQWISSPYHI
jgi:hypothetical protein